jgi:hypothetical protein
LIIGLAGIQIAGYLLGLILIFLVGQLIDLKDLALKYKILSNLSHE